MPKKAKNPRPPAKIKNLVGKLMCSTSRLNLYIGYKGPGTGYKPGYLYPEQFFVVLSATPIKGTQFLHYPTNKTITFFSYDLEILVAGTNVSAMLLNTPLALLKEVTKNNENDL